MIRSGALKELKEKCLQQAGGNVKKANQLIVDTFREKILGTEKVNPRTISFKALFEGLVDLSNVDINNLVQLNEAVASSAFTDTSTLLTHAVVIEPFELRKVDFGFLCTDGDAVITDDETVRGMTALGGLRRRLETQSYEETDFEEKKVTIRKMDFGRGISLTFEAIFNDRTGDIMDSAQNIGDDGVQHREKMIIETLECLPRSAFGEATSRAFVLGGTAFVNTNFYNTNHSAIAGLDGQINNNKVTGGITEAGFASAFGCFAAMKDERGQILTINPEVVVVHKSNELTLGRLLLTEKAVGSAYNDVNMFGPKGAVTIRPVATPFLATTAGLFYFGVPRRSMLWLWVQKPNSNTLSGNTDAAVKRKIVWEMYFNYYGGCGHRDYRYVVQGTTS